MTATRPPGRRSRGPHDPGTGTTNAPRVTDAGNGTQDAAPVWPISLFPQHAQMLEASGITADHAAARGYVTVDIKKRLADLSITPAGRNVPGLLVPQRAADGSVWGYQYRPDRPRVNGDEKPVKYETPFRQRNGIDVPPGVGPMLADPTIPLWVTEGVKKADAAALAGLACVALPGVWSWRGSNGHGGKTAIPDWHDIALNGRRVVLAFDSDVTVKPGVRRALTELAKYLTAKGARVEYAHLPDDGDGKTGLDDYLVAHGVDELWALVRPDPPAAVETAVPFTPPDSPATVQPRPPKLADAPRILDLLIRDVVALGVVGERTVVATTYLVITSRLLDKQASLAVKGHSASGKSYAVQAVVGLFPAKAVCVFTGMSERALIYSEEQFAYRTIVLYEAAALREKAEKTDGNQTAYFLRSLLSEGRISYDVTVKNPDSGYTTKKIVKKGPTNLVLTTTQVHLHNENETRMLSMTTNDSREQTSRVLAALADETANQVDVDKWLQLQRWLATAEHRVTVPYAGRLAALIPPVAVRLRRDFGTLLALIRAHAVLHQLNRDRDDAGRVVASLDDYEVVRDLVGPVLSEGVSATVSPTLRETIETVQALDRPGGATASVLAQALNLDKSAAYRRLQAAAADGYVQNLEDKRGRPGRWRTAAELPEDLELLPTCNQLATPSATIQAPAAPDLREADSAGCTVAPDSQGIENGSAQDPSYVSEEPPEPSGDQDDRTAAPSWDWS